MNQRNSEKMSGDLPIDEETGEIDYEKANSAKRIYECSNVKILLDEVDCMDIGDIFIAGICVGTFAVAAMIIAVSSVAAIVALLHSAALLLKSFGAVFAITVAIIGIAKVISKEMR